MRQPIFSIVNTVIYLILAITFCVNATSGASLTVGPVILTPPILTLVAGIMFLMAYFSLVHLKNK